MGAVYFVSITIPEESSRCSHVYGGFILLLRFRGGGFLTRTSRISDALNKDVNCSPLYHQRDGPISCHIKHQPTSGRCASDCLFPVQFSRGTLQGMSATPTPLVLSLDATYGALLVGTFIGLILYGTSLHQLFRYIWLFGSDVPSIRLLVAATMILETLHAATTVHVCYFYLVSSYLEPTVLLYANWSLQLIPALTALTACVSKVFLARRAFLTGPRSKWAVIVIMMLLATELGLACVLSIKGFLIKNLLTFSTSTANILAACEATAAAADALLAGTIIATLWAQGYRARHASLGWHSLFMTYVIKSGLLTAILNVLALILAQTQRKAFLYAAVNVVTARVYANTLFTVLNSRKLMANGRMEVWADTDVGLNTIAQANRVAQAEMWNVPYRPQTSPGMIKVNVTAEREEDGTRRPRSMAYGHKSDMSLQSV